MEELAAFAAEVPADKDEWLEERRGAKVVDFHVASHSDDVEGAVELAHGFVEEGGDDATMDVAGWAFVEAVKLEVSGCGGGFRGGVGGEDKLEALRIGGTAAEAMAGALVDGRVDVHGGWRVACSVGEGHGFRCCKLAHSRDIDDSCSSQESAVYDVQASMIAGPNRSIFSRLRPLMVLSWERV